MAETKIKTRQEHKDSLTIEDVESVSWEESLGLRILALEKVVDELVNKNNNKT